MAATGLAAASVFTRRRDMSESAGVSELYRNKLESYFRDMSAGEVPTARRFWLEGYLQSLVDHGLLDEASLQAEIVQFAQRAGIDYPQAAGTGTRLPYQVERAPVVPTSRD